MEKRETEMMENKSQVTIFNVKLKMLYVGRLLSLENGGKLGFKKGNTGKMGNKIMVKIEQMLHGLDLYVSS